MKTMIRGYTRRNGHAGRRRSWRALDRHRGAADVVCRGNGGREGDGDRKRTFGRSRIAAHAPTTLGAAGVPPMAPGIGGPNIGLPPARLSPFEGDVAVKDLRRRLSMDPDLVPQPPYQERNSSGVPWFGRLLFVWSPRR